MSVTGLLLAAGAGRRMGTPKALLRDPDGTAWVARAARVLGEGGCSRVVVVVGAAGDRVAALVPMEAEVVHAAAWAEGMGASLRAGLAAVAGASPWDDVDAADAVLVMLVDTPGVTPAVVARLVARAGPAVLARASYRGRPGHPVLLGREHWTGVAAGAAGDAGARLYLSARRVAAVECGDVGDGRDLDRPEDVEAAARHTLQG